MGYKWKKTSPFQRINTMMYQPAKKAVWYTKKGTKETWKKWNKYRETPNWKNYNQKVKSLTKARQKKATLSVAKKYKIDPKYVVVRGNNKFVAYNGNWVKVK